MLPIVIIAAFAAIFLTAKSKAASKPVNRADCYARVVELVIANFDKLMASDVGADLPKDFVDKMLASPPGQALQVCLIANGLHDIDPAAFKAALAECRPQAIACVQYAVEVLGEGESLENLLRQFGATSTADCVRAARTGASS